MIAYLGELSHTGKGRSPNVVPLAAGYLAAFAHRQMPDTEISIFRDPAELLAATRTRPPDVVGFSVYDWSEKLSSFIAKTIKRECPWVVTIAGGASIDDVDVEVHKYLVDHPEYDLVVPNEGEVAFLNALMYLEGSGQPADDVVIEGCARLGSDGTLYRGAFVPPDISDVPSPYLEGYLDSFLDSGYDPVLQSMRGCPYRCTFCVSGNSNWSKMIGFDLDRVKAEFDYIRDRTSSEYLILTDENLGILKDRDVEFAGYIARSFAEYGYPSRLYFYTAKLVTDWVLKVIETLAPIGEFGISFQTLDEEVRKEIKRTNTKWPKFVDYVKWADEHGIQSSTELIFGLPGETAAGYIGGVERLLKSGVTRIYSYNLRLLNGIDLATQESREKYRFATRFRLPERTYGVYDGTVVNEIEEVVVGSDSFDFSDYLAVRRYGLFLELVSGRGYLSELVNLMVRLGLAGEKLVAFLACDRPTVAPNVADIVAAYDDRARAELFETPEECTSVLNKLLAAGRPLPEAKINYIFIGKLMLAEKPRNELFALVRQFVREEVNDPDLEALLLDYIDNIALPSVVSFAADDPVSVMTKTAVNVDRVSSARSYEELRAPEPMSLTLELHNDAQAFIRKSPVEDYADEGRLQDVYMTVSRFGLVRGRR